MPDHIFKSKPYIFKKDRKSELKRKRLKESKKSKKKIIHIHLQST
jgi:hypothetical protein